MRKNTVSFKSLMNYSKRLPSVIGFEKSDSAFPVLSCQKQTIIIVRCWESLKDVDRILSTVLVSSYLFEHYMYTFNCHSVHSNGEKNSL